MPHKLLLADDSVTIQRVIELTFADEDVSLTAVGDGKAAIERIQSDPPDIVLADVGMPELDGYEVAAFIKNNPALAHIPVLLLTGAFEPVDEERARAVSCDGVLAKPFEPQMVITRVKELLADAARTSAGPRAALAAGRAPVASPEERPAPETGTDVMGTEALLAHLDAGAFPSEAAPAGESGLPPRDDEGASVLDAALGEVPIRRRPTMPVPDFGVPPADLGQTETLPAASQAALDDYFDRLGAAFSGLEPAPRGAAPEPAAEPDAADAPAPLAPPFDPEAGEPAVPADSVFGLPAEPPDGESQPTAAAQPAAGQQAPFARAFSALLAAEQGEDGTEPVMPFLGAAAAPAIDEDALADRVTRAVIDRMSDRMVRDAVTDIVSRVAERLVREEIARIKSSIR